MPLGFLGNVFGSAISASASRANTRQINEINYKIAQETNKANREMVEMQNKAAKQEAELAYKRSSAPNQVGLMTAAGMSRAGAINALNGGGSYTPAPVNTSQDSAPQMQTSDLSALANIGQGLEAISQRKHEEKMQAKQLAASKEQHQAQLESNERIAQLQANTTNRNADNRLNFDKEVFKEQLPKIRAEVKQIVQNTENLKKVGYGQHLDNVRKELENKNYPTLAELANTQAWQQIEYTAMKLAHENAEHMNLQEKQNVELEFYRAVMDSGISLQNAQNELQAYLANQELNMYADGSVGSFIGALAYAMDKLVPKFATFK